MSRRQALWQEHGRFDSYLSWIVRDVVGLVADLLGIDLRDMSASTVIDTWTGPTIDSRLPPLHVHRRKDGEILYFQRGPQNAGMEVRNRTHQLVWSEPNCIFSCHHTSNQMLYILQSSSPSHKETLCSLDYDTLQVTVLWELLDLSAYMTCDMSLTHMVLYIDTERYFLYDLAAATITPFPVSLVGNYRYLLLNQTHFFAYEPFVASDIRAINLVTHQLDYSMPLSSVRKYNYVFTDHLMLTRPNNSPCELLDLRDGSQVCIFPVKDSSFDHYIVYRRDDQYYLTYVYPSPVNHQQMVYYFME